MVLIYLRSLPTKFHERFAIHAHSAIVVFEIRIDQVRREHVVASFDRRVCGEHVGRGHEFACRCQIVFFCSINMQMRSIARNAE